MSSKYKIPKPFENDLYTLINKITNGAMLTRITSMNTN